MKLNIGSGRDIKDGWYNVDAIQFEGVDAVWNLTDRWPVEDGSVDEIHCSHVIEHFDALRRCHVYNEMHRVLRAGGKVTLIAPHWANGRAYGDPTHCWPPVAEMSFYYLSRAWRDEQAPHTNGLYTCDFEATWGYSLSPDLLSRNAEFQQFALNHYTNAAMDIHATLVAKK